MPFNPRRKVEKFLQRNPDVSTIVVTGAFGRKSAIRSLGIILGQVATVTVGVNQNIIPDLVIFDYKSSQDFPNFRPDVVIVTSCRTKEQAQEFFGLANQAGAVFVNHNDVPADFVQYLKNPEVTSYGDELPAHYYFEEHAFSLQGYEGDIVNPSHEHLPVKLKILGEHNVRPVTMAAAVAKYFGMQAGDILKGINEITPLRGRMSPAKGLRGSTIIDDSAYISANSVHLGIQAIEQLEAPAKIVVTNSAQSVPEADLERLTEVAVLGQQPANAPAQEKIHYFNDELSLMNYIGGRLEPGTIVLLEIPLPDIIESYVW